MVLSEKALTERERRIRIKAVLLHKKKEKEVKTMFTWINTNNQKLNIGTLCEITSAERL